MDRLKLKLMAELSTPNMYETTDISSPHPHPHHYKEKHNIITHTWIVKTVDQRPQVNI